MHTYRAVIGAALDSPATEAELQAAAARVTAEAARLGRFSSLSSQRLASQGPQPPRQQQEPGGTEPQSEVLPSSSDISVGLQGEQVPAAEEGNGASKPLPLQQQPESNKGSVDLNAAFIDLDLDFIMPTVAADEELGVGQ